MFMLLVPTAAAITILLTVILLKVYRECMPDNLTSLKYAWVEDSLGLVFMACTFLMSLGIGIKVANLLFG